MTACRLGEALAARGYAVLAADALGWGSRQGNGYVAQQALAANLMQFGLTLAGVIAAEDAQMARWLARHPAVDPRRVGVLGFSFGGFRAWQAAALCPEVSAGVAVGWMGRLCDLMRPGGNQLRGQSAFCMLHPALGGRLDYPDVAGLAAPKPMLFMSGAATGHFPPAVAEAAYRGSREGSGGLPVQHRLSTPPSPTEPMSSRPRSRRAPLHLSSAGRRRARQLAEGRTHSSSRATG